MLFVFPFLLAIINSDLLMYILAVVASVSALEDLVINLLSNEWQANKKSILIK